MTTTTTAANHRRFRATRTNSEETNTILAFRGFMWTFRHRLLHHLRLIILVFYLFLIVLPILLCFIVVVNLLAKERLITAPTKSLRVVAVDTTSDRSSIHDRRGR
jgi:hypothetical protein